MWPIPHWRPPPSGPSPVPGRQLAPAHTLLSSVLTAALLLIARPAPWQVLPNVSCASQSRQASQQQRSRQAAPPLSAAVLAPHEKGGGAQNVALASMHAYLHGGVCAYKDVGGGAHAAANQHRLPNLLRGGS